MRSITNYELVELRITNGEELEHEKYRNYVFTGDIQRIRNS
ncbi:MAG TPA: hypothetical protein VL021_03560 [Brumimicrobium sp.]|nr:hypothetical protein [Brumimicrobium sp.]